MAVPNTGMYEAKRRTITDQYTNNAARNAYTRFLSQQRGQRDIFDYTDTFKKSYPSFGASFAPRGMAGPGIRSGVMQRSMQDYIGGYQRNLGRMNQDLASNMRGFDLQDADLEAWKTNSLAELEMQKAQEIANAALNLEALRPLLGGL